MDEVTRERSKKFIDQVVQKTQKTAQSTSGNLQNLAEIFSQYAEVVTDLLEAKAQYVSIVEKYLQDNPTSSAGSYFPGLLQVAAQFSQTEMQVDSTQMDQMAGLVKDLEFQREGLEDQLERMFKSSISNIKSLEALSAQASSYLDQLIEEVGEIYGSSSMQQLVQRSSV